MTDFNERSARKEAELTPGAEVRLVAGRTEDYEIAVNLGGITEVYDPLDITTAEGKLAAMELMRGESITVIGDPDDTETGLEPWTIEVGQLVVKFRPTLPEAIEAAWRAVVGEGDIPG